MPAVAIVSEEPADIATSASIRVPVKGDGIGTYCTDMLPLPGAVTALKFAPGGCT